MGVLAGLLFLIGLGFFLAGAWPVIGFLGLELLVVWGAFKLNYRAARHRETIHTTTEELMVESRLLPENGRKNHFRLVGSAFRFRRPSRQ